MVGEEGTKRVNETIETVNRAGDTIGSLGDAIAENARAAAQISAVTNQQVTGITQIQQAMNDVNVATGQNVSASRQAEEVAQSLHQLGSRLRVMLAKSEEHTSELQSLMRISYAVFCLKKKKKKEH